MTTLQITSAPGIDSGEPIALTQAADAPQVQAPSTEIVYDNLKPFNVTCPRGRVFGLAKPGLLKELNFVEMMGETASNAVYMAMVSPIKWLQFIDGEPVSFRTRREWNLLVSRVEDDGLAFLFAEFIKRGIIVLPKEGDEAVDLGKAAADAKANLKNS